MAEKLTAAEKDRDRAKKKFDTTQAALEKAVRKWLVEKDSDKELDQLRHMGSLVRHAVLAGEDLAEANEIVAREAKASGKK